MEHVEFDALEQAGGRFVASAIRQRVSFEGDSRAGVPRPLPQRQAVGGEGANWGVEVGVLVAKDRPGLDLDLSAADRRPPSAWSSSALLGT